MPEGGSLLLHRVAQKGYARITAKSLSQKRLKAIKLLKKIYDLDQSEENLRFLAREVDLFFSHSSEYSDYLDDEMAVMSYLVELRSNLRDKAKESGVTISSLSPKKSGCFIATAATGSYEHPKVITLRFFRDDILKNHLLGRLLISFYYKTSPPIAHWIEKSKNRKKITLWLVVNPLSKFAERMLRKNI